MNLDLFQCPRCHGALAASSPDIVRCSTCGETVASKNAIIDFVAGHSVTMLDNIDYDAFYRVEDSYSDILVENIKSCVGAHWPASLGTVLEIGCGTGGFSRSLLRLEKPDRAVLTDVSPKMLQICRDHLNRLGLLAGDRVSFATYSGAEQSLAPAKFDTCVGTSVLHHILDVGSCLADLQRVLKPGGKAFFLEPNLQFHRALYATLGDIVAYFLSKGAAADDPDLARIVSWMCEVRCNVVHANDLRFLATREDKHLFLAEEIELLAIECGFGSAEALPANIDRDGADAASVYLAQCQVGEERLSEVRKLMPVFQSRYFSLLDPRERSPSFVLVFSKSETAGSRPGRSMRAPAVKAATLAISDVSLRCHLQIRALEADKIFVEGWCVAIAEIKWLKLTIDEAVYDVTVWLPRLDVQVALNPNGIYPAHNALCSGVSDTIALSQPNKNHTIAVGIVLTNGYTVEIAPAALLQENGLLEVFI